MPSFKHPGRFLLSFINSFILCVGDNSCKNDLDKSIAWKWDLDVDHRCNIERISLNELKTKFKYGLPSLYKEPLIIYSDDYSKPSPFDGCVQSNFALKTSMQNITNEFKQDFELVLSSSNSFSAHRKNVPISKYLDEMHRNEVLPNHLSNETWYLFGETYTSEWQQLLTDFCSPPCETCTEQLISLSFGMGGRGSGVQWHTHGPGFSQVIHGRKHWILYPTEKKPNYNPDYTSRKWMEETYTSMFEEDKPFECTLEAGEQLYFPDRWHHATINLDSYNAFVSTFTTEQ